MKIAVMQEVRPGARMAQTAKGVPNRNPQPEDEQIPLAAPFLPAVSEPAAGHGPQYPRHHRCGAEQRIRFCHIEGMDAEQERGYPLGEPPMAKVIAAMARVLQINDRFLNRAPYPEAALLPVPSGEGGRWPGEGVRHRRRAGGAQHSMGIARSSPGTPTSRKAVCQP